MGGVVATPLLPCSEGCFDSFLDDKISAWTFSVAVRLSLARTLRQI